ncbi:MAG TPA: hypothetical protein PL009_12280 [Flavipsychrobacter sp.]|nr:hypothetical protein [Flavipsychrobacter sp.]
MSSIELQVYDILKSKFGEKEAAKVIDYFEQKAEEKINQKKDIFLTKDDKVDLIKRMFAFWVGTIGVLSGIMFILLNAYLKH